MRPDAAFWIQHLNLTKHVEGGSFRETYRSPLIIKTNFSGMSHSSEMNDSIGMSISPGAVHLSGTSDFSKRSDSLGTSHGSGTNVEVDRAILTSIYFMLEQGQFSAFHKISSDETWHFYEGDTLDIFEFDENKNLITHKLGRDPLKGESFQVLIRAGRWFGSRVAGDGIYSLVGCTVAPGFDFADFQLANRDILSSFYPAHKTLIAEMTYT